MSEWVDVPEEEVQPGDWAEHKHLDLDPREVVRVKHNTVYLRFTHVQGGPFLRSNYTYRRRLAGE